jgi:hypothetical protein
MQFFCGPSGVPAEADYLAKGGTVAAWKEHFARQRQSEVY